MREPCEHPQVQLSAAVTWQADGDRIYIYGDRLLVLDVSDRHEACKLLSTLELGATREDLFAALEDHEQAKSLLDVLQELGLLVPGPSSRWIGTRLERQVAWLAACGTNADESQSRLCNAHVAVLGLGGIGSIVLENLVGAGVGTFTLIDFDRVEPTNLNRQSIYRESDIGAWKANVSAAYIERQNPRAKAFPSVLRVTHVAELLSMHGTRPWHCLVTVADYPSRMIQLIPADFCEAAGVPVVGATCGFEYGSWGPLLTPEIVPAWRALTQRRTPAAEMLDEVPPAKSPMHASFGPANAIVGALLARDIVLYLAGLPPFCLAKHCTIHFPSLRISSEPVGLQ